MQKIKRGLFIFLLFLMAVLLGLNYYLRPFEKHFNAQIEERKRLEELAKAEIENNKEDIKDKVDPISELNDREKISLLFAIPIKIEEKEIQNSTASADVLVESEVLSNADQKIIALEKAKITPLFITLFGQDISAKEAGLVRDSIKDTFSGSKYLPRIAVDHEGGSVQRLSGNGFTKLPSWQKFCKLEDAQRQELLASSAGELKKSGVDVIFAPVLDIGKSSVLKDRICDTESYATVARRSEEMIKAYNGAGIMPVLKHFPGIGLAKNDLHQKFDTVEVQENDVKLYKYIIEAVEKVGVMVAHVGVTNQDKDLPCSLSSFCISEFKNVYPEVPVFSDALEMQAAFYNKNNVEKSQLEVVKEAILAGNEILVFGDSLQIEEFEAMITALEKDYNNDEAFKNIVDMHVRKNLLLSKKN